MEPSGGCGGTLAPLCGHKKRWNGQNHGHAPHPLEVCALQIGYNGAHPGPGVLGKREVPWKSSSGTGQRDNLWQRVIICDNIGSCVLQYPMARWCRRLALLIVAP